MMALNARTRFWCGWEDGRWRVLAVFACALSVMVLASAQEGVTKYNSRNEPCMCVWYYLCTGNETTGTIKQHGEDIIEPRLGIPKPKEPTCDEGVTHICCKLPANQTTPADPEPQPTPKPQPVPQPVPQPSPQPIPIPRPQPDIEPEATPVTIPRAGCGVKRIPVTSRVTDLSGGEDNSTAYYAEFPWMLVVVTEQQPGVYKFECGASLIQPQVALTAAHCIQNLDHRRLKVRGGEWNTRSTAEPSPHQDRNVRGVIVHPQYAPGPLFNDIALVILNEPFDTNENVDTICIPVQDANFDGSRCYATGWGKDSFDQSGSYHHILRKVDLPIVPRQECQASLRRTRLGPFFRLHNSFVCAGGEPEKDTCKGDGGGPLVCPIGDTDRWTQVGIVSWGIDCGTNNPAVYVNVPMYTEWILGEIDAIRRRPPPRGPPPRPQRRGGRP